MLTRLALFLCLTLALPLLGFLLSGGEMGGPSNEWAPQPVKPLLIALLAISSLFIVVEFAGNRQRSLLKLQRQYLVALGMAGAACGWLMSYLNHYAESWLLPAALDVMGMLILTALFAVLIPCISGVRTLLAGLPGVLQKLARLPALPALSAQHVVNWLAPIALLGLIGGAAWPGQLFWLMWLSPLLLLVTLQGLWHERSIFAELATGDWGRVLCAALSGVLVCNVAVLAFQLGGGTLIVQLPNLAFAQLGYALFGLLSLQLADVIAEHWRGKQRGEVFPRKPFPIPVVSKKE